jgi:hypothetical protein
LLAHEVYRRVDRQVAVVGEVDCQQLAAALDPAFLYCAIAIGQAEDTVAGREALLHLTGLLGLRAAALRLRRPFALLALAAQPRDQRGRVGRRFFGWRRGSARAAWRGSIGLGRVFLRAISARRGAVWLLRWGRGRRSALPQRQLVLACLGGRGAARRLWRLIAPPIGGRRLAVEPVDIRLALWRGLLAPAAGDRWPAVEPIVGWRGSLFLAAIAGLGRGPAGLSRLSALSSFACS